MQGLDELVRQLEADGQGVIMTMGKGGVGKTTLAAALAVALAHAGHAVHLSTTDPAAHLGHALGGALPAGLQVSRIDPAAETRRYSEEVLAAAGPLDEEERALLQEDLRSPCTEEIAVETLSGQMIRRTSSSRISAAVPGERSEARVSKAREIVGEREPEGRRALPDLERREGVHVQIGQLALDRLDELDVVVAGERRVDAALEADLDRASLPGLVAAADDLVERDEIGRAPQVLGQLPFRERAEAATEVADVGVVDVPVTT